MATILQAQMLRKIALSEYTPVNGAFPSCFEDAGRVWADVIIEDAEDRGVVRSLVNAGLVGHEGKGKEAILYLTETGYATFIEIEKANKPSQPVAPTAPVGDKRKLYKTATVAYDTCTFTKGTYVSVRVGCEMPYGPWIFVCERNGNTEALPECMLTDFVF